MSKCETPRRSLRIPRRVRLEFSRLSPTPLFALSSNGERIETGLSVKPRMRCSLRAAHRNACFPVRRPEADCEGSKVVVRIVPGADPAGLNCPFDECKKRFEAIQPRRSSQALCGQVRRTLH